MFCLSPAIIISASFNCSLIFYHAFKESSQMDNNYAPSRSDKLEFAEFYGVEGAVAVVEGGEGTVGVA